MSLKDRLNSQPNATISKEYTNAPKENSLNKETAPPVVDGLGILDAFFVDENLNSVYVSGARNVYVERKGVVHKSSTTFRDNVQLTNLIRKNVSKNSKFYDEDSSSVKFNYKKGVNVQAALPPISDVPTLFVKNYCDEIATTKALQDNKTISKEIAMVLEVLASTDSNILIAGNPQSLKTTFLSAIAKNLPIKNLGAIVDYKNELNILEDNYTNYDFLSAEEYDKEGILNLIFNSNLDRVVINDCDETEFYPIINHILLGSKGVITTINALTIEDALDKIIQIILKNNPAMSLETAKNQAYRAFDIVLLCNKNEDGLRTLTKISEINSKENQIKDIFYLNENKEHSSTGYVPEFCALSNTPTINSNIFDENYKHTYSQGEYGGFSATNNLIKKIQDNVPAEQTETPTIELNQEEILKKAQEKFEELKKNAKNSELNKEQPQNNSEPTLKLDETEINIELDEPEQNDDIDKFLNG